MKITKDQLKKLIEQELKEEDRWLGGTSQHPRPTADDEGADLPAGTDIGYSANISRQRTAVKNLILALSPDKGHQYVSKAQASKMFQTLGEYNPDVGRQQKAWNRLIESFIVGLENLRAAQTKTMSAPPPPARHDFETADTVEAPRLAREDKRINKSDLQQIIAQELKTILD